MSDTEIKTTTITLARFSVLTRRALAFVFFIVGDLLKAPNGSSFFVMFPLIADVVYHPFQDFAICEFVIDVVRTRSLKFADPVTDQERWRDRNRDMHVSHGAADFMKDEAFCLQRITANVTIEPRFDFGADWQTTFHMPSEVEINFGVSASGHEVILGEAR